MKRVARSTSRGGMDRISSLSDYLIHLIMSFLTAQEAVRTCILSKRWKNLWATLPFLDFDMSKFKYANEWDDSESEVDSSQRIKLERFRDFVSMTLLHRETSDVHKFRVSIVGTTPYSSKHVMFIRSWINYALKRNLQVFNFDYALSSFRVMRSLPVGVFTCASLVDASLYCIFCFAHIKVINLPCLKRLYLRLALLDRDTVEKLFCGCPVLEVLHLKDCYRKYATINSQSLKYLTVENCCPVLEENELELLNTPNLLSFCYTNSDHDFAEDDLYGPKMLLKMPSLTHASINISYSDIGWYYYRENNILAGLSTVQNLTLSGDWIKDLLENELPNCPEFSNLKDLFVDGLCLTCHFNLLASFLNHCPYLEKLSLHCDGRYCEELEADVNQESLKIAPFKGERLKKVDVQFFRSDKNLPLVSKYLQDFTENSRAQIIMTSLCKKPSQN